MQLAGSLFLLLFLPLSLLPALLLRRHRAPMLASLSVIWYVLANYDNPLGFLHIFCLVTVALCLTKLPSRRIAAWVGIPLSLAVLLTARIFAEYTVVGYPYPAGLTLVTLGVISLLADRAGGDGREASVAETISYLLFFPTVMLGPVLRYTEYLDMCDRAEMTLPRFSEGVRLYMGGYIKRIAVAALLTRTLQEIFAYEPAQIPLLLMVPALPVAYFALYFLLSGTTSMARGVALMYGMEIPPDHRLPLFEVLPHRLLEGMLVSLGRYVRVYIYAPLGRLMPGRFGRAAAAVVACVAGVFFFRLRPSLLLLVLPMLLAAAVLAFRGDPETLPRRRVVRGLLWVVSAGMCALFAVGLMLPRPMEIFAMFGNLFERVDSYELYRIYASLSGARYLFLGVGAALAYLPLAHLHHALSARLRGRRLFALHITESVLLFAGFFITLVYFMPQFPEYALRATDWYI